MTSFDCPVWLTLTDRKTDGRMGRQAGKQADKDDNPNIRDTNTSNPNACNPNERQSPVPTRNTSNIMSKSNQTLDNSK